MGLSADQGMTVTEYLSKRHGDIFHVEPEPDFRLYLTSEAQIAVAEFHISEAVIRRTKSTMGGEAEIPLLSCCSYRRTKEGRSSSSPPREGLSVSPFATGPPKPHQPGSEYPGGTPFVAKRAPPSERMIRLAQALASASRPFHQQASASTGLPDTESDQEEQRGTKRPVDHAGSTSGDEPKFWIG